MSKLNSRPTTTTDHDADLERWRVAGEKLRAKHPQLFEELLGLGRCAISEYEAGEAFEAHVKIDGFVSRLATAHRIDGGAS